MSFFAGYIAWFQDWSNPNYWIMLALVLFWLGLIGVDPIRADPKESPTLFQSVLIKSRQLSLFGLFGLVIFLPATIWAAGVSYYGDSFSPAFAQYLAESWLSIWEFPVVGILSGKLINFAYHRYILAYISALKRRYRVRQSGEELSDIRSEEGDLKAKNYDPVKHYKEGFMFFGLDEEDKPIYVSVEDWNTRHIRAVGPTQTGKGVQIGVQLDQSIRKGDTVFFIDPKPDKHAKAIMKKAAQEAGRKFVECDLNPEGRGKYAPFSGGSARDRRARLIYVLGLKDTGTSADFYKSAERSLIDSVFEDWDGQLKSLKKILTDNPFLADQTKRAQNYINEWLAISTFTPDVRKGRGGMSIQRCLEENAVVYIRGNLDDEVINMACSVLLIELSQEVKRLAEIKVNHTFIAVDEVAFLINERFADALATLAGFDTNILLAYQSDGDLLNLKDQTLNAKAISSRVKVNTKHSLYYMAQDFETAQNMADDSGTVLKSVTRAEKVTVGKNLTEEWQGERDIHKVEENLITTNKAKMLPERVGVLYRPATNATLCFTCWINIDLNEWGDKAVVVEAKPKKVEQTDKLESSKSEKNEIKPDDSWVDDVARQGATKKMTIDDF